MRRLRQVSRGARFRRLPLRVSQEAGEGAGLGSRREPEAAIPDPELPGDEVGVRALVVRGQGEDVPLERPAAGDLRSWQVTVQVTGKGAFATRVAEVEVGAGENALDVRLGKGELAGEIRGRVTERASGRPLSSREVQIALLAVEPDGKPRFVATGWADAKGAFRLRYLRPGKYVLKACPMKGGLAEEEIELVVGVGEVIEGADLALRALRTGRVRFTVRDPEGAPVGLVSIESFRDGERLQGSITANSHTGVYATSFEIGTHDVTVRDLKSDLSWTGRVEVREGETTEVDVVLGPGGGGK